jgi:hypothetical protein
VGIKKLLEHENIGALVPELEIVRERHRWGRR